MPVNITSVPTIPSVVTLQPGGLTNIHTAENQNRKKLKNKPNVTGLADAGECGGQKFSRVKVLSLGPNRKKSDLPETEYVVVFKKKIKPTGIFTITYYNYYLLI